MRLCRFPPTLTVLDIHCCHRFCSDPLCWYSCDLLSPRSTLVDPLTGIQPNCWNRSTRTSPVHKKKTKQKIKIELKWQPSKSGGSMCSWAFLDVHHHVFDHWLKSYPLEWPLTALNTFGSYSVVPEYVVKLTMLYAKCICLSKIKIKFLKPLSDFWLEFSVQCTFTIIITWNLFCTGTHFNQLTSCMATMNTCTSIFLAVKYWSFWQNLSAKHWGICGIHIIFGM